MVHELTCIYVNRGGLGARGDIGPSGGRNAMLDVGLGERVGVKRLDVEHDGDDVQVHPQLGTQVRALCDGVSL